MQVVDCPCAQDCQRALERELLAGRAAKAAAGLQRGSKV